MTASQRPDQTPPAIGVGGVGKQFPGVVALEDVTLEFATGHVTAVIGENGAGKSTLMTIMAGLQRPDAGTVVVNGRAVETFTPHHLLHEHGVALVPQEIALCRDRTVAENVLLGREPGRLPSRRQMVAETRALLEEIDTPIDPMRQAGLLSLAEQQLVLIVRALARQCRILILDEPTTSLTPHEVVRLFSLLRRLREGSTTIVYVSHRLPEIFELSDHIHVLRDGRHTASFDTADVDPTRVVEAMVGRTIAERVDTGGRAPGDVVLDVSALASPPNVHEASLCVRAGEIVGVAGLPDSGRSELISALFGARASTGRVTLDGRILSLRSPRQAIAAGIGYVPAERRTEGLFPDMTASANATMLEIDGATRFGVVRRSALRRLGERRLREYGVRGQPGSNITGLSGGNQQKIILSRWLARKPRLLLLDDPTRGVDIGAKSEIHDRLIDAATSGAGVLMSSSDLAELIRTCDRIVVMCRGRVAGTVDGATATEQAIMALASNLVATA